MTQTHGLPFSQDEIESILTAAVIFANKDVEGFAEPDTGRFLDNTWKLMPETNVPLRTEEMYTIKDYRLAIQKMEGFLSTLPPDNIFYRYKGAVSEDTLQRWVWQARINLEVGSTYLGVKLLGIAVLEALAEETGGNVPLSLFMGDTDRKVTPLFAPPDAETPASFDPEDPVFVLLAAGRTQEIDFDSRRSPISSFLYKYLEPDMREDLIQQAKAMFKGEVSGQEFLQAVEPTLLSVVVKDVASRAITRQALLQQYVERTTFSI
jgi:hypothetical protein